MMPRPTRLNLAGIPQHVMQRGNNRQKRQTEKGQIAILNVSGTFNNSIDLHQFLSYVAAYDYRLV